jgi:hypothetical protein
MEKLIGRDKEYADNLRKKEIFSEQQPKQKNPFLLL